MRYWVLGVFGITPQHPISNTSIPNFQFPFPLISRFLYNLSTAVYFSAIKLAALLNGKAKKWVEGRKNIFQKLETAFAFQKDAPQKIAWFHCASLGEFEQGRTVIEKLKKGSPGLKILLTFFSPSGFEIRKNYAHADWVFYLPAESKKIAARFIDIVRPTIVVFVKYEFWFYYLTELKSRNIPVFLIAAIFRKKQPFFKWYGGLHRSMLQCFEKIYVQDNNSILLLKNIQLENTEKAGDPRVDRVLEIAGEGRAYPLIKDFCKSNPVLVAGSTWKKDEQILSKWINKEENRNWKLIVAPHDISNKRIKEVLNIFGQKAVLYSALKNKEFTNNILIIDNIGMLAWLYQFGKIAYIGGGFGDGIHNTLEPMAFNLPVLYGPKFLKFREAVEMQKSGGHFTFKNEDEFSSTMKKLTNEKVYDQATNAVFQFMNYNKGTTATIVGSLKCSLFISD